MASKPQEEPDVMALAGLRRLVLHARDQLNKSTFKPQWDYKSDSWSPWQVEQYAAMLLASRALTLVADCLPNADGITADEAAERDAKHAAEVARLKARQQSLSDQLEAAQREKADAEAASESAAEYQLAAEEGAESWSQQWQRLLALAQSDVPAAMRYLMAGGVEEDESTAESEQPSQESVPAS